MPCPIFHLTSLSDPAAQEFFRRLHMRAGAAESGRETEDAVRRILDTVRTQGDDALFEYTRRFDCPQMTGPLSVSEADRELAAASLLPEEMEIISEAAANIREFHQHHREDSWFITRPDGTMLGQKIEAVDRVGLYVPGGKGGDTPLVSSLLMSAIPAQVAGVREIAVVSPPRPDGTLSPYVLAAAYLLEISEVYRVGGPWAVGALAFGTRSVPAVDVIAGPGNIHVTTAKRLVQGQVGIDMLAGPSEILILADDSALPEWVAADLLSQAEHDALASAILVTDSPHLAERAAAALAARLADLPRASLAANALRDYGAIMVTPHVNLGVDIANAIAPEHLELCIRDPWAALPAIRHAGAVFLGNYSPECLGDYFAGPNHVLPTLGSARHASALGVQTFRKRTNIIAASRNFAQSKAGAVARLARLEGLEAHARAAELRGVKL